MKLFSTPHVWFGALLLGLAAATIPQPVGAQCSSLTLNEIDYDQEGTDTLEFVELIGIPGAPISGYELRFVNGGSGNVYRSEPLTGTVPVDSYVVIGAVEVMNLDQVLGSGGSNLIQNGAPDGVGIWEQASGTYCDFINYEGLVAGFDLWPDAGQDSPVPCAAAHPASLSRREASSPAGTWVEGACASPGEPNESPTAAGLQTFTAVALSTGSGSRSLLLALTLALLISVALELARRIWRLSHPGGAGF